jgi:chemotaxis protein CheD
MKKIILASTGEIKSGRGEVYLETGGIGSCIAVAAYDLGQKVGILAHIMLPGRCPKDKASQRFHYAADAIDELTDMMGRLGGDINNAVLAVVGGANVLQRDGDTICKENIESTFQFLSEKGLAVACRSVGGIERRTVSLDVAGGRITYTQGDRSEKTLWEK